MQTTRPRWSYLFFAQIVLVVTASVLATRGKFPTTVFKAPFDKVGHLFAYGGLGFLAVAFFGHARRWKVLAVLVILATLEEFSQRLFPTRTFDLGDLVMNVVGIVAFGMLAALVSRKLTRFSLGLGTSQDERPGCGPQTGVPLEKRGITSGEAGTSSPRDVGDRGGDLARRRLLGGPPPRRGAGQR